jgi:AcrR family transcriptional regulator
VTSPNPDELAPWRDPDELLSALYATGREPMPQLRDALLVLVEHADPDIREEVLRILGTRWKDAGIRPRVIAALKSDIASNVRSAAAFAIASSSTAITRKSDSALLVMLVKDEAEDLDVRAAAYDALLILHRGVWQNGKWTLPTKQRAFDPVKDVDWRWIECLTTER